MHVVLFTSDDQTFAIPTRCIVEVIAAVQWRTLPQKEPWFKGLFNYRGTLLPLLDLALLLGQDPRPMHRTARILVVRSPDPNSSEPDLARLGLLVQRVLGSEELDLHGEAPCCSDDTAAPDKFLGPVILTPAGTVQLIHVAGLPARELS